MRGGERRLKRFLLAITRSVRRDGGGGCTTRPSLFGARRGGGRRRGAREREREREREGGGVGGPRRRILETARFLTLSLIILSLPLSFSYPLTFAYCWEKGARRLPVLLPPCAPRYFSVLRFRTGSGVQEGRVSRVSGRVCWSMRVFLTRIFFCVGIKKKQNRSRNKPVPPRTRHVRAVVTHGAHG